MKLRAKKTTIHPRWWRVDSVRFSGRDKFSLILETSFDEKDGELRLEGLDAWDLVHLARACRKALDDRTESARRIADAARRDA